MIVYQVAVLVWGVVSALAALALAAMAGSLWGAALVFAGAGLVHLLQVSVLDDLDDGSSVGSRLHQQLLQLAAIAALLCSILVSLWS